MSTPGSSVNFSPPSTGVQRACGNLRGLHLQAGRGRTDHASPGELRPGRRVERVVEMAVAGEQQIDRRFSADGLEHFGHGREVRPGRAPRRCESGGAAKEEFLRQARDVAVRENLLIPKREMHVGDRQPGDVDVIGRRFATASLRRMPRCKGSVYGEFDASRLKVPEPG